MSRVALRFAYACVSLSVYAAIGVEAADVKYLTRSDYRISVRGSAMTFEGTMSRGSANDIENVLRTLRPSLTALIITSPGGDAREGLRIGRLIHDNNLSIEVKGFCFSACAQYLFVAATKKIVDQNSLVAFHSSPSYMLSTLRKSQLSSKAELFSSQAALEQDFYRLVKVSLSLLSDAAGPLQPVCVFELQPARSSAAADIGVASTFTLYIPTRTQMKSFGVGNIIGFWPETDVAVDEIKAQLPFSRALTISFGGQKPFSSGGKSHRQAVIPTCDAPQRAALGLLG